jgi:hypothetical protein
MIALAEKSANWLLCEDDYIDSSILEEAKAEPFLDRALRSVVREQRGAYEHFSFPLSRATPAQRFHELAAAWRSATAYLSSPTDMAIQPAYQQIIGMGYEAVPFILAELRDHPDHWFWALKAITGVDPVQPEHRGKIAEMAEAWIRWGRTAGYEF